MWHGQQAFKALLLKETSIRAWTTWHGQQVFEVWLWEIASIRTWTTWHGQQAFKIWLLARILIRALTMWHGQQTFKVWLSILFLQKSWMWYGQKAFRVCPSSFLSILTQQSTQNFCPRQCGPGHYVSWIWAILLWCVEKNTSMTGWLCKFRVRMDAPT